MHQSVITHKILSLNKTLHQLNVNNRKLAAYVNNPTFDYIQTKIMMTHASISEYFEKHSGMKLYEIDHNFNTDKRLNTKEQYLRQHERILVEAKKDATIIESYIDAAENYKQVFYKLYKLFTKQLELVQQEIKLLLNSYSTDFNTKQTSSWKSNLQ